MPAHDSLNLNPAIDKNTGAEISINYYELYGAILLFLSNIYGK